VHAPAPLVDATFHRAADRGKRAIEHVNHVAVEKLDVDDVDGGRVMDEAAMIRHLTTGFWIERAAVEDDGRSTSVLDVALYCRVEVEQQAVGIIETFGVGHGTT